jgi:hypothetical protein
MINEVDEEKWNGTEQSDDDILYSINEPKPRPHMKEATEKKRRREEELQRFLSLKQRNH